MERFKFVTDDKTISASMTPEYVKYLNDSIIEWHERVNAETEKYVIKSLDTKVLKKLLTSIVEELIYRKEEVFK